MIPKIIHYCWLSSDPYPKKIQKCISSWKRVLPDYEFMLWDLKRFDINDSIWVRQAYEAKKYAFAADYLRAYAVFNYGGIYLDSDVEVIQPFDDLLNLPYFFCRGNSEYGIEAATFGCEKGLPLMADLLEYYKDRHFIKDDGSYDLTIMPDILRAAIENRYQKMYIHSISDFSYDKNVFNLFPSEFFSPICWETGRKMVTGETYSIHHYAASWHTWKDELKIWLHKKLGHGIYHKIAVLLKHRQR